MLTLALFVAALIALGAALTCLTLCSRFETEGSSGLAGFLAVVFTAVFVLATVRIVVVVSNWGGGPVQAEAPAQPGQRTDSVNPGLIMGTP